MIFADRVYVLCNCGPSQPRPEFYPLTVVFRSTKNAASPRWGGGFRSNWGLISGRFGGCRFWRPVYTGLGCACRGGARGNDRSVGRVFARGPPLFGCDPYDAKPPGRSHAARTTRPSQESTPLQIAHLQVHDTPPACGKARRRGQSWSRRLAVTGSNCGYYGSFR